jgi:hypothetical protein
MVAAKMISTSTFATFFLSAAPLCAKCWLVLFGLGRSGYGTYSFTTSSHTTFLRFARNAGTMVFFRHIACERPEHFVEQPGCNCTLFIAKLLLANWMAAL